MPISALSVATLTFILAITTAVQAAYPYRLHEQFENGDGFMRVRLLGALELPYERVQDHELVELSGLAWDEDDEVLYAVSDHGVLFHIRLDFAAGYLSDAKVTRAFRLHGSNNELLRGQSADAEGLEILNGRNGVKNDARLLVSFERVPRVNRYTPTGRFEQRHELPAQLKKSYRGSNRGFESVTYMSEFGILVAAERPATNANQNMHQIFDLGDSAWSLPRFGGPASSLVAIEAMADGSLIFLERSFVSVWRPLQIIIRRAARLSDLHKELVNPDPIVVFNSFDGWRLDNFEGMTHHEGNKFFLVSDDNENPIQRTLLIYLEILDKPVTKSPNEAGN